MGAINRLMKLAALALGLAAFSAAHATDGVLEIHHAKPIVM